MGKRIRWTEDKEQYIRENYGRLPTKEVADYLGATVGAVRFRAGELGVRRPRGGRSKKTMERIRTIYQYAGKYEVKDISKMTGIPLQTIFNIAADINIHVGIGYNSWMAGVYRMKGRKTFELKGGLASCFFEMPESHNNSSHQHYSQYTPDYRLHSIKL